MRPQAEIGALRMELVETRSYWITVGTESDDLCPYKTKDRDNRKEAGVAKMQLQAKDYQKPPESRKKQGSLFSCAYSANVALSLP